MMHWELAKVFIYLKHFSDNDVLLHFDIPMGDGTVKKVPRKPGLRKNAEPVNLPNCPSYLQGSSEHPDRLDKDEIDIRHFHQALELSCAEHKKENDSFSVSDIDGIQQKYSTLNLSEKLMYIRSSQTTLHIFKKLQSGPLLTKSHQICIDDTLHVKCFVNEDEIPTQITPISDIRQISQLTQELETHQQDDIEIGINNAIYSVRSTIEKLTTCEKGKDSQSIFNRLQFI